MNVLNRRPTWIPHITQTRRAQRALSPHHRTVHPTMPSSSKDPSTKGKKRKSLPSGADSQPTPSDVKVVVSDPSSSAGPVFGESSPQHPNDSFAH